MRLLCFNLNGEKMKKWKEIIRLFEGIEEVDIEFCNLESMSWLDYMFHFLLLKILHIVYRRNVENAIESNLWGMKGTFQNVLQEFIDCSDDADYNTLIEGLEEFRDAIWNPLENEIEVGDALIDFDWTSDDKANILQETVGSCLNEISLNDRKVISEQLATILNDFDFESFENDFELNYCITVVKFPWIHKALSKELERINPEVVDMLEEELLKIDTSFWYWGYDSFYCIEMAITTTYSYEYAPSLCTPFKLAMLEEMAKEACLEAGESSATPQKESTVTV